MSNETSLSSVKLKDTREPHRIRSTGSEPSLPFPPSSDLQPLATLNQKYREQEAHIATLFQDLLIIKRRVTEWTETSGPATLHELKIQVANLLSLRDKAKLMQLKDFQRDHERCIVEATGLRQRLQDLKFLRADKKLSELEGLESLCLRESGVPAFNDVTLETANCLGWRKLEDAVRLRSMRVSALKGYIGSLEGIEEEVAIETVQAKVLIGHMKGICTTLDSGQPNSFSIAPEAQQECSQALSQTHIPIMIGLDLHLSSANPIAAISGFPSWQEGTIARAAWGRRS